MLTALSVNKGGLGRFANQCFTIAGTIGIAVKSGQSYGFPEWVNRDNSLFGGQADKMSDYLLNPLPPYIPNIQYKEYGYFWGYRSIHLPTESWDINAHLQSDKYFSHCIDLIRRTFTFKDEPELNNKVAIHVRMGDYIQDPNAYHPVCSIEYYQKAMEYFPKGTKYILFSDEPERAMQMFEQSDFFGSLDIMPSNTDHYIEDFKLMKSCHSFITANSSFSLMAAILGDQEGKKIVCPSRYNWFGKAANGLDASDIVDGYIEIRY